MPIQWSKYFDKFRKQNRVYILPTKMGLLYFSVHFILLFMGVGYQNNLILILFGLLSALSVLIMIEAHFHLEKILFHRIEIDDSFLGEFSVMRVKLEDQANIPCFDLKFLSFNLKIQTSFSKGEYGALFKAQKRGKFELSEISLSSTYPFGFFRVWTYLKVNTSFWVYPSPIARSEIFKSIKDHDEADFDQFKNWSLGDRLNRVAWKKLAQYNQWVVKDFTNEDPKTISLKWEESGQERDLSQLVAYIIYLDENKIDWNLLNVSCPKSMSTFEYKKECLRWLSEVKI